MKAKDRTRKNWGKFFTFFASLWTSKDGVFVVFFPFETLSCALLVYYPWIFNMVPYHYSHLF